MKAVGYVRVSGTSQLEGAGIDRQEDTIQAFARKAGIEVVKVYQEAHTGTEADRPVFMEMLADLLGNGIRVIVIESLDRLSRDLLVQSSLLAKLASEGVTLIAALTGEDITASMQTDPMRRALVQIQGVFAELDKNLLIRRLRKGKEKWKAEGKRVDGRLPYGEKEGEQAVLDRVRALRRKRRGTRLSWEQVADTLNSEGLRNRSGESWTRQNLWKVCQAAGIR